MNRTPSFNRSCPGAASPGDAAERASLCRRPLPGRGGSVYILAMVFIAIFSALAVGFVSATTLGIRASGNHRAAMDAQLAAESGLSFMLQRLGNIRLPGTTTQATFLANLQAAMAADMGGTANLAGGAIAIEGNAVQVPAISLGSGAFTAAVSCKDANHATIRVEGTSGGLTRRVEMDLDLSSRRAGAFDFGLASRGRIEISGSSQIVGVNNPAEASVISVTSNVYPAISISGNVIVSGDLSVSGQNCYVDISGTPTIAGSSNPAIIAQHIHAGVTPPDFPAIDVAPLAALATNVVNSSTDISQKGTVFKNIRIAAGTNPTFSSDIEIQGVVYIEAPNNVRFEGQTTLRGMIVTEPNVAAVDNCQIHFAGHVDAYGVETLPTTAEFAAVRQQTGTFIVAPGFGVTFAGSFSAINGSIAADQLTFTGTAEGVVQGSVIGLADRPTSIGGNVEINVDRAHADSDPAGFINPKALTPDPDTYREVTH